MLNEILEPYVENHPYTCKNSFEFVNKIKNTKLHPYEKMYSQDATALFPSVPISDALGHILTLLENDPDLGNRTKLSPYDIIDLMNTCLSSTDFIYNNRHHTTEDSGPIGLSLMVKVSQLWMLYTLDQAVKEAKKRRVAVPRLTACYVDDIWNALPDPPIKEGLRSGETTTRKSAIDNWIECLNSVHPRVQFTKECEENGQIAFPGCPHQKA